jgi:tryptophanyl-tRNA synthetase
VSRLQPLGEEIKRLTSEPKEIDAILADGAARAHAIAKPVMDKVKDIVGFVRS